jgi:hypothetical protein
MSKLMTRNDVLDLLNTHIKQAGSVSAAARILAKKSRRPITQQMIEPVLAGRRGFGPTLLRALGLRKVVGDVGVSLKRSSSLVGPRKTCPDAPHRPTREA